MERIVAQDVMGSAGSVAIGRGAQRVARAGEAAVLLAFASVAIRTRIPRQASRLLGGTIVDPPVAGGAQFSPNGAAVAEARRLAGAVARVARVLPWRPACLAQAIALRIMLRRREIPSYAHLGVVCTEPFGAHAWVTVGGQVVLGGGTGASELAAFA